MAEKENIPASVKPEIGNIEESKSYVGSGIYNGNTMPDSLLEDSFKESDSYDSHLSILKSLKKVLKEEYGVEGKLIDIFDKAMANKYGKEYAALNQALPLLKKAFNICSCDVVLAVNELVMDDDFRMKWLDVSNTRIVKMELEDRYFPKHDDIT